MTSNANDPDVDQSGNQEDEKGEGAPGVETTTSDDGGSTFEPEEDPEGHSD